MTHDSRCGGLICESGGGRMELGRVRAASNKRALGPLPDRGVSASTSMTVRWRDTTAPARRWVEEKERWGRCGGQRPMPIAGISRRRRIRLLRPRRSSRARVEHATSGPSRCAPVRAVPGRERAPHENRRVTMTDAQTGRDQTVSSTMTSRIGLLRKPSPMCSPSAAPLTEVRRTDEVTRTARRDYAIMA